MEIRGKYNTAQVYTDLIEDTAVSQIMELCSQEWVKDSKVRIMPDVHAGKGCTIGTTMTLSDKVCPNLVGVDIGCGMLVVKFSKDSDFVKNFDAARFDAAVKIAVPCGKNIHARATKEGVIFRRQLDCIKAPIQVDYSVQSIGTLGGGNHFIEVDTDEEGALYLVIHSGSRHLGIEICKHYQEKAFRELKKKDNTAKINATIEKLKAEGKTNEIENTIKILKMQGPNCSKDLAYLEGANFNDYIHDMKIAQEFANINRISMFRNIAAAYGIRFNEQEYVFTTIHNYIDTDKLVLRKGAVSAEEDERLIIPMNMRDGSLICIGKGNPEWNCSAPHGAGRLMSRSKAKENLDLDEFKMEMEGIYSTTVNIDTIDESPMAYKPMQSILDNIGETVSVETIIKPIYNFKAAE